MEIERKFLVADLPDLEGSDSDRIEQGYLAIGADGEVRLRRKGESRVLTVKRGSGLSRDEAEIDLGESEYEALWPLTEGRRLYKRRHLIGHDGIEIELDVYEGELEGLTVAEVEFRDEEEAGRFSPPGWMGEEVTGEGRYLNETLASRGAPPG